jgi:chromosome segregation ATPase
MADKSPPTIDDELNGLQTDSKARASMSQLLDGLKSDIEVVAKKQRQSTESYTGKHKDLVNKWKLQRDTIYRLKTDIKARFPSYPALIKEICPILDFIERQQAKVDGYIASPKTEEKAVAEAKRLAVSAKSRLDAWLTADTKLATRLADIDKAITNLQGVFGGVDQVFAIYLLWFQVIPPHREIAPEPYENDFSGIDPPPCLPPLDTKAVRLVDPNDYELQLQTAWHEYRNLRMDLKKAQDALNEIQDDVAGETALLKTKTDSRDNDIKQKLKSLTDSRDNDIKRNLNASSPTRVADEGTGRKIGSKDKSPNVPSIDPTNERDGG